MGRLFDRVHTSDDVSTRTSKHSFLAKVSTTSRLLAEEHCS
jgi:hypothetical protein